MKQLFLGMLLALALFISQSFAQNYPANNTSTAGGPLLSPETKAFLIICGYGTVGGGLLGLASMAFGGSARNMAKGASVGLYAGIIFGAYVIYSHESYAPPSSEDSEGNYNFGSTMSIKSPEFISSLSSQNATKNWYLPIINYRF